MGQCSSKTSSLYAADGVSLQTPKKRQSAMETSVAGFAKVENRSMEPKGVCESECGGMPGWVGAGGLGGWGESEGEGGYDCCRVWHGVASDTGTCTFLVHNANAIIWCLLLCSRTFPSFHT